MKGFLNESPDTLSGGTLLFHYDDGTRHDCLFAISTLFRINPATLIVTLPAVMDVDYRIEALAKYERLYDLTECHCELKPNVGGIEHNGF